MNFWWGWRKWKLTGISLLFIHSIIWDLRWKHKTACTYLKKRAYNLKTRKCFKTQALQQIKNKLYKHECLSFLCAKYAINRADRCHHWQLHSKKKTFQVLHMNVWMSCQDFFRLRLEKIDAMLIKIVKVRNENFPIGPNRSKSHNSKFLRCFAILMWNVIKVTWNFTGNAISVLFFCI